MTAGGDPVGEAGRRRTFAIISHPDAAIVGVTTTHLCHSCYKRDYLTRGYRHIPPGHNPAK